MEKFENSKRENWGSRFGFIMAAAGSAVGLGNIWRFNYVLYSEGGGAFFIPYFTAILIMGIPFLILEYGVGYKFKDSLSNILKKIKPKLESLGWFVVLAVFLVLTYYIVIVGWDFIYLILSFFKGWGADPNMFFANNIIVGGDNINAITQLVLSVTAITALLWALLWYVSHKSVDGIEKTVKILIPVLFILMIFIVLYALTLPGQMYGITELLKPDWSLLGDVGIWLAAFGQILFSLSMGQAMALTYASYLPEDAKLTDSVLLVVLANSAFEIFTAFGVFSILGFMCLQSGLPIEQVATSGTGLLFIVFPQIFNIMGDVAYILGPLFFLCVLFAGFTSIIALFEPMLNTICMKFKLSRTKAASILTIIGFIISILFTTGAGNYLLTVVDEFLNQFAIVLGVILQAVIFGWIYGVDKIIPLVNKNSKFHVGKLWTIVIKVALPIILTIMWIQGMLELIGSNDHITLAIEAIVTLILIIVPAILTALPEKQLEDVN